MDGNKHACAEGVYDMDFGTVPISRPTDAEIFGTVPIPRPTDAEILLRLSKFVRP